jgi:hypothetical protein
MNSLQKTEEERRGNGVEEKSAARILHHEKAEFQKISISNRV